MTDPAVLWPVGLGLCVLVVGLITYRRDAGTFGLAALGPVFVASALAAFAGEHFTAAASLAQIVPNFLPGRLFIAYFVGVAHLAAALSFVAKRYVRVSSLCLAIMFGLFVLLMDLPGAITHPSTRIFWVLAAREATFAIGALALFATVVRGDRPGLSDTLATVARLWTAAVLVFYGIQNILFPKFSPGVPDTTPTASWVLFPTGLAYAVGCLLVAFGLSMFVRRYARAAGTWGGALMLTLTVGLFVPQFFLAHTVAGWVNALNFVFDTMLFGGTVLVVANAVRLTADG